MVQELRRRRAQGERPLVEEFFSRNPEVLQEPSAAIDLIYEEICLREQNGDQNVWEDTFQRFPQWRDELQALRSCHRLLQPTAVPRFPEVGETLGEFRLLAELGRGARGRVLLASQPALASRPVVLKLTPRLGAEHLSLARLQHTHIVPLYSARDDSKRQLRLLCMPYLGNATLDRLLGVLSSIPCERRSGQDLVAALDKLQESVPLPLVGVAAAKEFFARATYVQTICWIGACCADALHYAHERGLVHLDLKPSNVLVAADGQPMLLDFHLAHEPLEPGRMPPDELGGTSEYMPPEQRAAVEAVEEGSALACVVDRRADVYSLGAVLYEALGGGMPFRPLYSPPLCHINKAVSVGLSDIVVKCLETDPSCRYGDAAALGADLRRHLTNHPLRGVSNRSMVERWQKWRRRRPSALRRAVLGTVVIALGLACAAGLGFLFTERTEEAERALRDGKRQWQQQQNFADAAATLRHGLARIEGIPFRAELAGQLRDQLRLAEEGERAARREQLVRNLHRNIEQLRLVLGMDKIPSARLRVLEESARALWEKREQIRERLGPSARAEVDRDLLELAISQADLSVRLAAPSEVPEARRQALQLLTEAESLFGTSAVLDHERELHQRALGLKTKEFERSARPRPRTVWEHTILGRGLFRAGQFELAAQELKLACDGEPHNPWSNYYYGLCAYHLKRYEEAALAFSVCVGAAPNLAGCYYSRALALAALGRTDQAIRDYDHALQLDPTMGAALLNRGMLHYQAQRYEQALADLRQALVQGVDPAAANYNLALVHLARSEREPALTCVGRALQYDPHHEEAVRLLAKLRTEEKNRATATK
jgi:serine/threonine protein kinase/tetratricopeptide (TPR) repeat protein